MRHILLPLAIGTVLLLGVAVVDLVLRSSPPFLETSIPDREKLVAMIAEREEVPVSAITLHIVDDAHEWPYVLYSLDDKRLTHPVANDRLPVVYRAIVHPRAKPWEWILGGGGRSELPDPGIAASLSLTSCHGCPSTEINTVIYGVAVPKAAKLSVSVQNQVSPPEVTTYTRDLRDRGGYLILLPDEGVTPVNIVDVHVLDKHGNELPAPQGVS